MKYIRSFNLCFMIVLCVALMSSCGGGGSNNDTPAFTQPPVTQPKNTLEFVAGSPLSTVPGETFSVNATTGQISGGGYADGIGTLARFRSPMGLAFDTNGNLYIGDTDEHVIRMLTPDSTVITLAGQPGVPGYQDGDPLTAIFIFPDALAVDDSDNIYVADRGGYIRKIAATDRQVSTVATFDSSNTSTIASRIAVDGSGTIYLAEDSVIMKFNTDGTSSVLAGTSGNFGTQDGTGSGASFHYPTAMVLNRASGDLYVADDQGGMIRRVNISSGEVHILTGKPNPDYVTNYADGTLDEALFTDINGLALDASGDIYAAEGANHDVRKISLTGNAVSTIAGSPYDAGTQDGPGITASFRSPCGLAFDASGNLYLSDALATTIRKIAFASDGSTSVNTVAGAPRNFGDVDGPASMALFAGPTRMHFDKDGNLLVFDSLNGSIRQISSGVVSTLIELGGTYGISMNDFVMDLDGNYIIVNDLLSPIYKLTLEGVLSVFAGPIGMTDSGYNSLMNICRDNAGNFYVTGDASHTIRKIAADSTISIFAGTPGMAGNADGPALQATFEYPKGIAYGPDGSVYVSCLNDTIRKIHLDGQGQLQVSTLAGTPGVSGSLDSPGALFNSPRDLDVDKDGNIFVVDYQNSTIRKILPDGTVSTVVGVAGVTENTLGPLPASIAFPNSVAMDPSSGALYISLDDAILKATF